MLCPKHVFNRSPIEIFPEIVNMDTPTPWCRVLLEKLTGLQPVKKFPAFYGTRRFITALTSVRHLSLSCTSQIQSTYPHPTPWRSILILSTRLRLGLPSGLFPYGLSLIYTIYYLICSNNCVIPCMFFFHRRQCESTG